MCNNFGSVVSSIGVFPYYVRRHYNVVRAYFLVGDSDTAEGVNQCLDHVSVAFLHGYMQGRITLQHHPRNELLTLSFLSVRVPPFCRRRSNMGVLSLSAASIRGVFPWMICTNKRNTVSYISNGKMFSLITCSKIGLILWKVCHFIEIWTNIFLHRMFFKTRFVMCFLRNQKKKTSKQVDCCFSIISDIEVDLTRITVFVIK